MNGMKRFSLREVFDLSWRVFLSFSRTSIDKKLRLRTQLYLIKVSGILFPAFLDDEMSFILSFVRRTLLRDAVAL